MKKKILICLLVLIMSLALTGCGEKDNKGNDVNNEPNTNQTNEVNNNTAEENTNEANNNAIEENTVINDGNNNTDSNNATDDVIVDDEIIDVDDEDNQPIAGEERVTVNEIINCDGCVFAYFSEEGDKAKRLGDTLTADEYTTDVNALKTSGGKQRHNFFGLVLSDNTISKAYACILKDDKIYCIEGSVDGAHHESNVAILNNIFTADRCRTISDGHTYTCTDGSYNGDSKTNGYTSMHYETSCTIYGSASNTGKLICH